MTILYLFLLNSIFAAFKLEMQASSGASPYIVEVIVDGDNFAIHQKDQDTSIFYIHEEGRFFSLNHKEKTVDIFLNRDLVLRANKKIDTKDLNSIESRLKKSDEIASRQMLDLIDTYKKQLGANKNISEQSYKRVGREKIKDYESQIWASYEKDWLVRRIWLADVKDSPLSARDLLNYYKMIHRYLFFKSSMGVLDKYSIEDFINELSKRRVRGLLVKAEAFSPNNEIRFQSELKSIQTNQKLNFQIPQSYNRRLFQP